MKSIFTIASLLIFSFVHGQIIAPPSSPPKTITIGQIKAEGRLVAEYYYIAPEKSMIVSTRSKRDTTFAIQFLNFKSLPDKRYVTVEFNETGNEADSIYRLLKTVFLDKNKDNSNYSISLQLNYGDILQAKPYKKDDSYLCELSFKDAYVRLSESEIDDLFKKKNGN